MEPTSPRLTFADAAQERAWWAWFAQERAPILRGGFATLVAGMLLFAPMDRVVFPELAGAVIAVRLAAATALAFAFPAFFGRQAGATLATHGQEWLLYAWVVAFAGLGTIGWIVAPYVPAAHLMITLVTLCILLAGLYGASGLRVRYGAPLGIGVTALYAGAAALRAPEPEALVVAAALFGGGTNVLGVITSYTLEREARRAFLRARALEHERARADALLLNIMPEAYARRLRHGASACVDSLPTATVVFATIAGFAEATAGWAPLRAVELLDRLVAELDDLAEAEGVERIKSIGATCLAIAGATRPGDATSGARLALAMRDAVRRVAEEEGLPLALRAGVATGPLVVGVIGRTRHAFDCWGDTVNTAARLDATSEPDRVQVDAATASAVRGLRATPRGSVLLKGKGERPTWWVDRP